jgi:hypothetical protein
MASTKTFADMKKPVRQPTPEQIAAFEETGRADRKLDPAALATETQKSVSTDRREHADTETSSSAKPDLEDHGNPQTQKPAKADSQIAAEPETRKAVNTETRLAGPIVRLTIDLHESDHTRFKAACAMTKRRMVDEVRGFIERRTAELEEEAGRAR